MVSMKVGDTRIYNSNDTNDIAPRLEDSMSMCYSKGT